VAEAPIAARRAGTPPRLSGAEKSAILLLTLGEDAASAVFRHLSETEVREVSAAIARLRSIPSEQAVSVHEEARRRLSGREGLLVDGEEFARQVIRGSLAAERARDASRDLERMTRAGGDFLASSLEPVAPAVLAEVLANEHPQAIAVVLANLSARKAANVLAGLPHGRQADVVERVARLQTVPEDVLVELGDVLHEVVGGVGGGLPDAGTAGARVAAEIMNVADAGVGERVFTHLDAHAPELGERIRRLMLTFEDLVRLDSRGMQLVLKEVQREDLMLALRTASPAMREKVFANLSQRAAEILNDDIASMGPVPLKEVENAQLVIVATVRRLESEQRLTLAGSGDDVVV